MPVGRVFDATQNQVLFSPVSNYYKGEAIRGGLAAQKQDAELKGLQIEAAKEEIGNAEKREQMWQMQYDSAEANLETSLLENGEKTMEFMATSLSALTSAAVETSITDGNTVRALADFNSGIQAAKSSFPKPIAEKVKSGAGEDGIYDAEEFTNLKMSLAPWWARDPSDRSPRDQLIDGKPATVFFDKAGNGYYEDGRPVLGQVTPFATNEAGVIGSSVNASGVSKNTIEFQDAAIGAVGAIQTGTELLDISASNPESLGVPGGLMRFGTNLVSGAKAIADWGGYDQLDSADTEIQDMGYGGFDYGSVDLDKLGASGAEAEKFRAGIYGIAFAAAVAEQGTRPTDKDIQQFIDQVGGRATSAQSFRETIVQFMRRQDRRLKTIADVKQIGEVDRAAAFKSWTPAYQKFIETYAKTSGKKTATDPETGKRFIEMSPGEWEEF